uniref:Phosphoinositide phospholipase C n=1 Tax=Steinernema glaseri TaxID=37863 RepID=A0A1I7YSX0_9BILA
MHYTTKLRVDPKGHILYWNSDMVVNTKDSGKRPLHAVASGQLCSYIFFEDVVDVRVTDEAEDDMKAQFKGYRYAMDIVTNKNFIEPRHNVFKHHDERLLLKWEAFVMRWAYKLKREYHGVTYYLQKVLSPHIYCCSSESVSMHTIIDVLSPRGSQSAANHKIVDDVIHDYPFREQTTAPVLIKKSLLNENTLADLIISACKMAPKRPRDYQTKELKDLFSRMADCGVLRAESFGTFLNETQRDPRLNEEAHRKVFAGTVKKLCRKYSTNQTDHLEFRGFLRFLLSDDNVELNAKRFQYDETTLSHPLSAYYINSSHNTYQIDEQIGGHANVEIYRQGESTVSSPLIAHLPLVLLSGCRCIELDCWDVGDDIAIVHGNSLSSAVSFRAVVVAIRETAFRTSDLPVLLSIENHCNKANQRRMAQIFIEIFGDLLLTEALEDHPLEPGVPLPSPLKLRRKILIKGKKTGSEERSISRSNTASSQLSEIAEVETVLEEPEPPLVPYPEVCETMPKRETSPGARRPTLQRGNAVVKNCPPPLRLRTLSTPEGKVSSHSHLTELLGSRVIKGPDLPWSQSPSRRFGMTIVAELNELEQSVSVPILRREPAPLRSTIASSERARVLQRRSETIDEDPKRLNAVQKNLEATQHKDSVAVTDSTLSNLINYLQSMSPREKEQTKTTKKYDVHYKMRSESETALEKGEFNWAAVFNVSNLTRIYPRGMRFFSDNYNPYKHWACGCQMVALNFQTSDLPMQLNQTLFEENGRAGYVLKPKCLRDPQVLVEHHSTRIRAVIPDQLEVTVIGAFMLSWLGMNEQFKSLVSHVQVGLYDMPADTVHHPSGGGKPRYCTPKGVEKGLVTIYSKDGSRDAPKFLFKEVVKPEYAFVYFGVVEHNSNKVIAQRLLPVHKLQPGYRFIVLRDSANRSAGPACLLVRLKVRHYVAPAAEVIAEQFEKPLDAIRKREELRDMFANPLEYELSKELES